MKKAFTMIELIFVIVIVGILSSVAVPKFMSSRDDAMAAFCVKTAQQFVNDLASYYTVHGEFGKVSQMSNISVNDTDVAFTDDTDFSTTSTGDFYCDGIALIEYNATKTNIAQIGMTSLSPDANPAAFKADAMLTQNGFYRSYILGGH